ncbi:hypothetical protein BDF21DRAFT_407645 [Thamnidium elegans]|nr:hypothetical protein BDF21DRAFT_407645 [Thamnidium elegans]
MREPSILSIIYKGSLHQYCLLTKNTQKVSSLRIIFCQRAQKYIVFFILFLKIGVSYIVKLDRSHASSMIIFYTFFFFQKKKKGITYK